MKLPLKIQKAAAIEAKAVPIIRGSGKLLSTNESGITMQTTQMTTPHTFAKALEEYGHGRLADSRRPILPTSVWDPQDPRTPVPLKPQTARPSSWPLTAPILLSSHILPHISIK